MVVPALFWHCPLEMTFEMWFFSRRFRDVRAGGWEGRLPASPPSLLRTGVGLQCCRRFEVRANTCSSSLGMSVGGFLHGRKPPPKEPLLITGALKPAPVLSPPSSLISKGREKKPEGRSWEQNPWCHEPQRAKSSYSCSPPVWRMRRPVTARRSSAAAAPPQSLRLSPPARPSAAISITHPPPCSSSPGPGSILGISALGRFGFFGEKKSRGCLKQRSVGNISLA